MSKAKGVVVIGLLGAAVLGAILLQPKSASAAQGGAGAPPELTPTDTPEEVYAKAMDPRQTDAETVQDAAEWLVSSGQRQDLGAIVNQKATALRAEDILAEAVSPDVVATSNQLKAWAIALQPIPAYLEVVQKRAMAQQGQAVVPASQTVTLLSGTGSLMVNYNAYLPTAAAASAPSPVVVAPAAAAPQVAVPRPPTPTLPDPKPKAKPKPQAQPATPAPIPMPASPAVSPSVTPISEQETEAEADPNGTIALARALLAEEQRSDWKRVSAAVESWQRTVGLAKPDGKFGPGSALRMAQEVGVMPLVRYWSTGGKTLAQQLQAYRVGLYDEARIKKTAGNPTHAAALVSSAAREKGQGWPKSGSDTSSVPFDFPSTAQLEQVEQNIDSLLNRGPTK
jgi:hypothetical protein